MRNSILIRLGLAGLLVAAGCGDDDSESAGTTTAPTGTGSSVTTTASRPSSVCEPQEVVYEAGADGVPVAPTVATDDDAFAEAIASMFCSPSWRMTFADGPQQTFSPRPVLTQQEALCIGDRIVEELGVSRASELRFAMMPWHLLSFALVNNRPPQAIDRSESETIAGVFEECSEAWKLLFMLSITEGTDRISEASAQCASDELADDDARSILVGEIDRAYDDPSQPDAESFADLVQPLIAAFEQCLSPDELGALDWN